MVRSKRMGWLGLALLIMVGSWLMIRPLSARADYSIDHYTVNVDLQRDGSANVRQTVTYDFDDDYHGVFNVQDLRGIRGAKLERVFTRLNQESFQEARPANDGADDTYVVSQNKDRMRVKVYQPVTDGDVLQVGYHYQLFGVVTNYADTAELNWRVIGTGWDVALHDVKVVIQLPSKNISQLQAWTHGPLDGHTTVDRKNGRITMTVKRNPANHFVESHLLFPTSVTATNQRKSDQKRKAAVQKQEAALAKQANRKRTQTRWLYRSLVIAAAVIWIVIVVSYLWWFKRHPVHPHTKPIPLNHSFDVPPVAPAVAESLAVNKSPNTNALTAEILRAAADGEITIKPLTGGRKPDIKLTRIKPVTNSFLAHCFKDVAKGDAFKMSALKKYGKRDQKGRLAKWFEQWSRSVDQEVSHYQDADNFAVLSRWLGGAVMVTIVGLAAAGSGFLLSPLVALVMGIVVLIGSLFFWGTWLVRRRQILINTDEGLQLINQINGLRRMLKDIGHFNTAEVGDLILWEQILPYAAAFGLAKKVTDQLAVDFSEQALADGFLIYYPLYYVGGGDFDMSGIMDASFNGALSASNNASSSSGGSGGFSGGSSGGFGGGSGGGAF